MKLIKFLKTTKDEELDYTFHKDMEILISNEDEDSENYHVHIKTVDNVYLFPKVYEGGVFEIIDINKMGKVRFHSYDNDINNEYED